MVPNQYLLQHNAGSTINKTRVEMDELIDFPINNTRLVANPSLPHIASLPAWLQHGSSVTYNHEGEFHKGFIVILADGTAHFSCRSQNSARTKSWGVTLPNLVTEWLALNCDHVLQPTWNVFSFLHPFHRQRN